MKVEKSSYYLVHKILKDNNKKKYKSKSVFFTNSIDCWRKFQVYTLEIKKTTYENIHKRIEN